MPNIKSKLNFNYDGKDSKDYGVLSVTLDGGLYEEGFTASREINEIEITGGLPILHDVKKNAIEFDLTIAFEEYFTDELLEEFEEWFFKDYYRPLYFEGAENRVFMCMSIGDSSIFHNGISQGYVTFKMRCNAPYLYSKEILTTDYIVGVNPLVIEINSDTHEEVFPELSIVKQGSGLVRIEKLDSNDSVIDTFLINQLAHLESIYVNGNREIVQSDIVGMYRYDVIFGAYPKITKGLNKFRVTGNCGIQFRYKNKYKR